MKKRSDILRLAVAALVALLVAGCSTTSNLPEDEVLYTGMKTTIYTDRDSTYYLPSVEEEVEAALACAPNGAIFGSSYYRNPLQTRLRIYNRYMNSSTAFGKWMLRSFGKEPVLISTVTPDMRTRVAENVLHSNGYFNAKVDYSILPQKNPKKAKVQYIVRNNRLYTLDTVKYIGYAPEMDSLIRATMSTSPLKSGAPFSVASLDAERNRLNRLFRDSGYYYYRTDYTTFIADSVSNPGHVELHVQPIADMADAAQRKWYLGKTKVILRRSSMEQITDSVVRRNISVYYSGKKRPIRMRAILRDIKLKRNKLYSYSDYLESSNVVNSLGLFSISDFSFTPRDTTVTCDTLDMTLNCVFDKPYDGSIEANYSLKSNHRTSPGLVLGMTKRNAFRGGEKLSINLKGSYEWQTGRRVTGSNSALNSYEYGIDASIEYPRIEAPFSLYSRHRFYKPPSTLFSLSANVLNRADYFKMLTVTGAVTYKFQTSANSRHELSPLLLDYNFMRNTTASFDSIMSANPAIYISMRNQFVPKIKYTYTYTSPSAYANPIVWETSVTEAGNILSLFYAAAGKKLNEKEKDLFGNPFAQFLKLNTSLRKTWQLGYKSQLVGHVAAGVLWAYGNSERAPYNEQFYVGGANSIRAFTVRSIGPGKYVAPNTTYAYLDQTGDIKLEMNLEYRCNLFGSLYGAVFLDAGNIWLLKKDENRPGSDFKAYNFFRQLATGTGAGLRYDMEFLVLRLDLGVALHVPYDTGKSVYYNIPKFRDGLGLHFAIGYPF